MENNIARTALTVYELVYDQSAPWEQNNNDKQNILKTALMRKNDIEFLSFAFVNVLCLSDVICRRRSCQHWFKDWPVA